jgi:hypothetical protein
MARHIAKFCIAGLIWVFLLSIPVGQGKSVYDLAHYFLVDSTPVNWIGSQFTETVSKTEAASQRAKEGTRGIFAEGREKLSEYGSDYRLSE